MESRHIPSGMKAKNSKSVTAKRKVSGKALASTKKKKKRVNEELANVKTDVKTHSTDDNHIVINRTLPVVSKKKLIKGGPKAGKERIKKKLVTLQDKRFKNGKLSKTKKKLKVADANNNKASETTQILPLTSPLFTGVSITDESSEKGLQLPMEALPTSNKIKTELKKSQRMATGKITKKSKGVKKIPKRKLGTEHRKQCIKSVISPVNVERRSEMDLEMSIEELPISAKAKIQNKKSPRTAGGKIKKKFKAVKKNSKQRLDVEDKKQHIKPVLSKVNVKKESEISLEVPIEELAALAKTEIRHKNSPRMATGKNNKKSKLGEKNLKQKVHTKSRKQLNKPVLAQVNDWTELSEMPVEEMPILAKAKIVKKSTTGKITKKSRKARLLSATKKVKKAQDIHTEESIIRRPHGPISNDNTSTANQLKPEKRSKKRLKQRLAEITRGEHVYLTTPTELSFQASTLSEAECVMEEHAESINGQGIKAGAVCETVPKYATAFGFRKKFKVGQKVDVIVKSINNASLTVSLAPNVSGMVRKVDFGKELKNVLCPEKYFSVGQGYTVTVLGKRKSFYLLSFLEPEDLAVGSVVVAKFTCSRPNLGIKVHLPCDYKGSVFWPDVSDEYFDAREYLSALKEHPFFQCCILSVDHKTGSAIVSLRQSRLAKTEAVVVDKEINTIDDLHENDEVRGYVKNRHYNRLYVTVGRNVEVCAVVWPETPVYFLTPGNVVKLRITRVIRERTKVFGNLILPDDVEMNEVVEYSSMEHRGDEVQLSENRCWGADDNTLTSSDVKKRSNQNNKKRLGKDQKNFENAPLTPKPVVIKNCSVKEGITAPHLNVSSGFIWDENVLVNADTTRHNGSSDEESEDDEKLSSKRKNKKKRIGDRLAEQQLFEREKLLMDGTRLPETVDDFDRLVLSSPNSSLIWLKYMSFHLQSAEIEKARAVGERALKTISFREEQEKLNVWTALLNLENLYGTPESLDEMLRRAVQYNDPLTVYNRLVNIYIKSGKLEAAEQLYKTMVKKFNKNKEVWINFGVFRMRNGQYQAAQKLMEQSFMNLPAREHVGIISKFAQLEFKFGEAQRGKTMLESVLSSYPTRTDVWSVYFDMVSRVERNVEEARQLFERAITMQLSAKKMKFFFKRYLEFEKEHGTEATVERVMRKAEEFVDQHDVPMDIDQ